MAFLELPSNRTKTKTKIHMKKRTITNTADKAIRSNLAKWFAHASDQNMLDGLVWYRDAQEFCAKLASKYEISPYITASVVSCLSPNNKWQRNKADAISVIKAHKQGLGAESVSVCTYDANKRKAFRVLSEGEGIASSAPKTHAFAMNVGLLSPHHVTVDKWHIRSCLCTPKAGIVDTVETVTAKQYRRIEAITAQLAKREGLKAYELQAIVWVTIKESWGR